ncbi:putative PurR-regulated permease PerM [Aliiruegeria haliotis]|uniref:Putative PurR-regulated permease PerM n=1 Tax=Aliiruegeria haliotis TaxID=1280846 RepID=A0A2T0RF64_9RHOB|nr:AI-2E family transporter [Aliiruegeria haliotis]PRY19779.1 putative PurR-regulated permease PerM [Aliiruegeria haliotis]
MARQTPDSLRWFALLAVTAAVSLMFLDTVQTFLVALVMAAIAAGLSAPLQARMMIITRRRPGLAAALTIAIVGIAVVAPLLGIIWLAASQAEGLVEEADALLKQVEAISPDDPLPDWVPFREELGRNSAQITAKFGEFASAAGGFLVSMLTDMTRGTVKFFLDLFIFFYAVFCFLQMKTSIITLILSYSGLPEPTQRSLAKRMISVSRATIKGTLLIGVAQGALGGLGFWAVGIEGAAFWGVVMAVLSVIPGLGPLLVVFCGMVWLFSQGEITYAIGLAAWGFGVVGTIDNILRPILVGRDAAMADIMILISTLGGLAVFGASGLVLGPVIAGIFVTLWDTVRDASRNGLAPAPQVADETPEPERLDPPSPEPGDDLTLLGEDMAEELRELRRQKRERDARKQAESPEG